MDSYFALLKVSSGKVHFSLRSDTHRTVMLSCCYTLTVKRVRFFLMYELMSEFKLQHYILVLY